MRGPACFSKEESQVFQNLLVAINAVVPFLCFLGLGMGARRLGMVEEPFLQKLTSLTFALMFPCMTFYNIYSADPEEVPSVSLLVFVGAAILALEGALLAVVPRLVRENARRGVIIQAVYRSNFVLFGLPLTGSIYGQEKTVMAAMLVTVVLTIYNLTSVVILELFNGSAGEKLTAAHIGSRLVKNPMLQGCCVGLLCFAVGFRLPACLEDPIRQFANMTPPLAMFALGGTLRFQAIRRNLRLLLPTVAAKLVLVPLVMVSAAYALGLRGIELFLVVAVFGTPVASGSYPMAMNMGGDGELAGQMVFVSTILAIVTLFLWIFFLGVAGLL